LQAAFVVLQVSDPYKRIVFASVEEEWTIFFNATQDAAEKTCETIKNRRTKPKI
jgi:hypothetical protein